MKHVALFLLAFVTLSTSAVAQGRFGAAVALSGDLAFSGSPGSSRAPGFVHVYQDGAEAALLTAPDGFNGDGFGMALAADGSMLLVGATNTDEGRGAAYVFAQEEGDWTVAARLAPPSGDTVVGFGGTVALSGDIAIVGAPSMGFRRGGPVEGLKNSVYVYRRDAEGNWSQAAELDGAALEAHSSFGASVAIAGDKVLVGAPGGFRGGSAEATVYPFQWDAGANTWVAQDKIVPENEAMSSRFGSTIAVDGAHVLVGAPGEEGSGAVYVYDIEELGHVRTLRPFDAAPQAGFGSRIVATPSALLIGAPGGFRSRAPGAIYAYQRNAETGMMSGVTRVHGPDMAAGDGFGGALSADGNKALVGVPGADYGAGVSVVMTTGADGHWEASKTLYYDDNPLTSVVGETMGCEDGTAGSFDCGGMRLEAFLPIEAIGGGRGVRLNDIWGWVDPATDKEYAIVGRIDGTSFVDISNPNMPVYLGDLPKTDGSPGASWRDMKVYSDHVFVVADASGHHGMQVFDLKRLRNVDGEPQTFAPDAWYGDIYSAHNIVINEGTGFAYVVGASGGGESCGGGLHMVDIREPLEPTFAGCFADTSTGRRGTGYSHDAQCILYDGPDEDYKGREICFGSNETALSIADVTDKENTQAISVSSYPNVAYSHQGWVTDDHRYLYMNDELDEFNEAITGTRTMIWDITDLDDPQLVREFTQDVPASDHNLYIKGNTMYQSNYAAGLRIFDISDPINPIEVAFFDTNPFGDNSAGFSGSWSNYPFFPSGNIIVSSIGEGLFVLKKEQPGS